ncbi:hypothetical protein FPOAC2_10215 [Fusarium poae]|uniref:Apple domain-containing protein n=1 Tax=Fusarium poae TaxID=36050 RepID=A0A1B8ARA7_FUSPO|nr:hypothetical protein FPOAC1_007386 [Fusarium poae]KAG8668025.1 hypothetical protein FPOAC1_007386 [Fusarium poae]OBS23043.1 hypothetical protein FPOA_09361 [Fusarium poae]
MVQLNIIAGSLGLFVLGVGAGPCRPTDTTTTTLAITETATATTDLITTTATETTASVTTTSAATEGEPACSIESPQYGGGGGEYEVYCDSFAGGTTPIGSFYFSDSLSQCLDRCDETPSCVGVNYITTRVPYYCTIWSSAGTFGQQKGVILAKRVTTRPEPAITAP